MKLSVFSNKLKIIFSSHKKVFIKILFILFSTSTYAQTLTQPLFMQQKAPKLESLTGLLTDSLNNEFFIESTSKDSAEISFLVTIPREMLSDKWGITLTPQIIYPADEKEMQSLVIKGVEYAKMQKNDYEKYNAYISSIVNSSMYSQLYIDQQKLEKDIESRHDLYWRFFYDEWAKQVEYEIWKSEQDGSIRTYSITKQTDYRDQLRKQYLLRIENQSKRYLKAGMDTTGLYAKYITELEIHIAKMPRFFVNKHIPKNKVPKKFREMHNSERTLDDITNSMEDLLIKRDSALMSIPILDYGKVVENEKRAIRQKDIFNNIVRLPKVNNALLDTIIYDLKSDFTYKYKTTTPSVEREIIKIKLQCKISATDLSTYSIWSEDILTYIIYRKEEKD